MSDSACRSTSPGQPPCGDGISRRDFGRVLATTALAGPGGTAFGPSLQPPSAGELTFLGAAELVDLMRRRQVSAREVMAAHLAQIARVNPKVNAIVTLVAERAMADAARLDKAMARSGPTGVLHGLPVAHKDLVDTAGIRTTRGSPFYRDHVPARDALLVTRIRAAGAVTVGKTNRPEFGAGSQTFNTVFGATRNPYDPGRTVGGSSGGAAAALAGGMAPIADGSESSRASAAASTKTSRTSPASTMPSRRCATRPRGASDRRPPSG